MCTRGPHLPIIINCTYEQTNVTYFGWCINGLNSNNLDNRGITPYLLTQKSRYSVCVYPNNYFPCSTLTLLPGVSVRISCGIKVVHGVFFSYN